MPGAALASPLLEAAADPLQKLPSAGRSCRCDRAWEAAKRWAALAAVLSGSVLLCLLRASGEGPAQDHELAGQAGGDWSRFGLPLVRLNGDSPALAPHYHWVSRVCTELYPGPNCSRQHAWSGVISLQMNGVSIPGVKMHTRGHVSTFFPKHQFSLELPEPIGLLGMAPARKWVLSMPFIDTTFQRNPVAFEMYRRLGGWSPQTRYVAVQWDDDHLGLYYIAERIEEGPGRLELPTGDAASAGETGHLVTVDWPKPGKEYVNSSETSTTFTFLNPRSPSRDQREAVQKIVNEVDRRASSPSGGDQLAEVLDFPSFARFFILQELVRDIDGYAFSDFMFIANGKLHHAAPWDFDLAFNFECRPLYFQNALNGENSANSTAGWNVENLRDSCNAFGPTGISGGSVTYFGMNKRQMFLNIWSHRSFRLAFVGAWREARREALTDEVLEGLVQERAALIAPAARADVFLWRHSERCAFFLCCHPEDTHEFDAATRHLEQYLLSRARWIDASVAALT